MLTEFVKGENTMENIFKEEENQQDNVYENLYLDLKRRNGQQREEVQG